MSASAPRHYQRGPLRTVWPSAARPARRRAAVKADADYGTPATPSWREVDWPASTHQIEIDGRTVNYVSLGEGTETIVFIHGLGGAWQNWLENIPAVAASGRRAIALDLPGFGRSAMPTSPISMTLFANTVEALCEQVGLGAVHVVGNSMGGFAAADLAIHHPARLKTLTLVDAAGVTSNAIAKNPLGEKFALAALGGSPIAGQVDEHGRPRAFDFLRRPAGVHALMAIVARHPTRISRELLAEQLLGTGSPGFIPSMKALIHYDYRGRLGEIASPTLILQGEKDLLVPLGDAYFYEHAIADTELVTFADTGHVPMLERPVAFNEVVLDFVARAEARAATASEPAAAAAE